MKKFFALLAVVLAVVSCQKDVDVNVNLDGDVATISVTLPADAITRAAADETDSAWSGLQNVKDETLRVIFQVYDENGVTNENLRQVKTLNEGELTANFNVRLVPDRQYTFVAWADQGEEYFDAEDLKDVKLLSWEAMDECRDAFTDTHTERNFTSSSNITLELIRPFAKLRVVTTDMEQLGHLNIAPNEAEVAYTVALPNSFNAFAGEACATTASKSFTKFEIAKYNQDAANTMTLFTDYILVPTDKVVKFSLKTMQDGGREIKTNYFVTDIPVERNNLTTIKGNVLTDGNNITVEVKPEFDGENEWPNGELGKVAMFGGEITLTEDVTLTEPLLVKGNMTLNLGDNELNGVINVVEGAKLTVNNGTIVNEDKSMSGITSNGDLTLNDVNIVSARHAVRIESGNVVINGGTYEVDPISKSTLHALNVGDNNTVANVTIKGGKFIGPKGTMADSGSALNVRSGSTVTIEGGDFSGGKTKTLSVANQGALTVKGGTFDQDPSNYCAAGYYALQYETGKYTVQAFDAATQTLTINSKDELLKLSILDAKWNEFFSNGQGTHITDFYPQNGGKGAKFYYKWEWTIKLNTDIDFENATLNAPISLTNFGCFDGQNHTINNVTIENDTKAGLFVTSSTKLQNIKLDNIHVTAGYVGNSCAGILASGCNGGIDNISIANSSVVGGKYTGGVIGSGYTYVTNCTLTNCVVKGGYKCGGVIGYICAESSPGHNVTGNTLTNCNVTDAGQYADGKSEYVLGKVVGHYNCNGTCADNVIDNMETTATALIGLIQAGKVVNESNNYVSSNVDSLEELKAAVTEENATVNVAAREYKFPGTVAAGVTIVCEEGTVFTGTSGLNINGATVIGAEFKNEGGVAVSGNINGTFKNCTFTGSNALRYCYAGETVVFEDCVFSGNVYGIHFDGGANEATFRNCIISGFNAFAGAMTMVNFEGCTFVGNGKSGYNGANLWGSATLKKCEFTFNGTTSNEWIDCIKADGTYSFEDCTVNGVKYTHENYTTYGDIFSRNDAKVMINGVECQL